MAGLPEIDLPTEGQGSVPVTPTPLAPRTAFSGTEAAAALQGVGAKVHQEAIDTLANAATAQFQDRAIDLATDYKAKFGPDALKQHPEYTKALNDLHTEILNGIPSRKAQHLAFDSTERTRRLIQEGIDSHFLQQHREAMFGAAKAKQASDVKLAAMRAADGDLGTAYRLADKSAADSEERYKALGVDPSQAEEMGKVARSTVANAVVKGLADMAKKDRKSVV